MAHFLVSLCAFTLLMGTIFAKNLGEHGPLFPIEEEDFLQVIQRKLSTLSPEQKLRIGQGLKDHYTTLVEEPPPVEGLREALEYRVYTVDPSITVASDIADQEGRIIIPRGTSLNPLSICSLTQELLFLDGDQLSHLDWARKQADNAKWILVKGKPLSLERTEARKIYFDQFGLLSRKFEILQVPAKVSQEGMRLKIEEIPVEES